VKNGMGGICSTYCGMVIQSFGWKPGGKEPLGRPRLRWEGSIKMDLLEVGWGHGLD